MLGMLTLVLGAGCVSGGLVSNKTVDTTQDSAFVGIDGSLTQTVFDQVADGFMTWVFEHEYDTDASVSLTQRFVEWQTLTGDAYPTTDTFTQSIHLVTPETDATMIQLVSAGKDGVEGTEDDFRKAYPYRAR